MTMKPAFLITGATGGLGRQTALALARRDQPVIIGGRRMTAIDALRQEIEQETRVETRAFAADLADLKAVQTAVEDLAGVPLAGIVANAGVTTSRDARTADGYELTFGVNVLAHQLLLVSLSDQVRDGGRIVVVSSGVHQPDNKLARRAGIPIPRWVGVHALARPDLAAEDALPVGPQRYSTSKLANVLQARGLQAYLRQKGQDVDVFAIDPGLMVDTDLARDLPGPARVVFRAIGRAATPFVSNMRLSPVSAQQITALLCDDAWAGRGFAYLDGDHATPPSPDAQRDDLAIELWRDTNTLLGLDPAAPPFPSQTARSPT